MVLEANARPGLNIQVANRCGLVPRLRYIEAQPPARLGPTTEWSWWPRWPTWCESLFAGQQLRESWKVRWNQDCAKGFAPLERPEGAAGSVMVGIGETYLPAFVLASSGSQIACGLVTTVPLMAGACLQLIAPWMVCWLGSYRRWAVRCALLQVAALSLLLVRACSAHPRGGCLCPGGRLLGGKPGRGLGMEHLG